MARRKPRKGKSEPVEYRLVIAEQCRITASQKKALLAWLESRPEFCERKPTIQELIRECRRRGSPLGSLMEHEQARAADRYWHDRAQYLLRNVHMVQIRVRTQEVIKEPIRAYIPVEIGYQGKIAEKGYIPAHRVADNPSLKFSVVERAKADFLAWVERYRRYAEWMDVAVMAQEELATLIAETLTRKNRRRGS